MIAAASPPAGPSGLAGWIHIEAIQALVHHTSAIVTAVLLFAVVSFLTRRVMHEGIIKRAVLLVDELALLGLFIYFAYELFTLLSH